MSEVEVELVIALLIVVSLVSLAVRRIKMPYTLGLIIAGLLISVLDIPALEELSLTPDLLLVVFLPALLFEGAMNVDLRVFFQNIKSIFSFAIFGLLLSVFAAGSLLHFVLGVPWQLSFLFAAMIAPTDPIAVLSIIKKLGVSKRLAVIIEGESLFNDGTGIVLFRIFLGLVLGGTFSFAQGVVQFLQLALGGVIIGFLFGYLFTRLFFRKIQDSLIKLTMTTVLAYGSYLAAEQIHVSGVIATVTAGLVMGGYGLSFMSHETKLEIHSFWSYFGFILNSFVFILIGVEIEIIDLITHAYPILVAFLAITIGRAIAIFLMSYIINRVDDSRFITGTDESLPFSWQPVIVWGGLHGGLSMVLALSLPTTNVLLASSRSFLLTITFGSVFLSLVLQGTTFEILLKKLGLTRKDEEQKMEYESRIAHIIRYDSSLEELDRLKASKVISENIYREYKKSIAKLKRAQEKEAEMMLKDHPALKDEQVKEINSSLMLAQRQALMEASRKGLISNRVLEEQISHIGEDIVSEDKI